MTNWFKRAVLTVLLGHSGEISVASLGVAFAASKMFRMVAVATVVFVACIFLAVPIGVHYA